MMKSPLLPLSACLACVIMPAVADPVKVLSPNGTNVLMIDDPGGQITYAITSGGRAIVSPTRIGITVGGAALPGAVIRNTARREVRETAGPEVPTHCAWYARKFNEARIDFDGGVALCARAYDDGVAFRWETSLGGNEVTVNGETMAISFAGDFPLYFPEPNGEGFFSHQECLYPRMAVSKTVGKKTAPAPLLADCGGNKWMLVSDVNVEGYPGMWFKGTDSTTMQAVFPPYPLETELKGSLDLTVRKAAGYIAKTRGERTFPWRAFVLTNSAGLLTSNMLYDLAEPSRLKDTSWIQPGKVAWDWWNANNIYGVPFRAGINQETYKHYIDFAAEMNGRYIILDEGWSKHGPGGLLHVVPEIDMPALVAYGRSKNVGVILWMGSPALEHDFEQAFEQFSKWGIAGLKVDFMQRDDQVMMDFLYRTAGEAAKRKLLVDFHGGSKPAGLLRTWPNVISTESVRGLEQCKWGTDANPDMAVLLPFTRMVVGPMDYTPGAMVNLQKKTFRPMNETPASQGTRAQQLAMYVVYLSPLQMLADSPTNYRRNPDCLPFLKEVPTTWDETRVLRADVGQCVAVARRKGDDWFIGGMTNWDARDLDVPLDFLGEGGYQMSIWQDGANADRNGNDVAVSKRKVRAVERLNVHLAPGGGVVAVIRK